MTTSNLEQLAAHTNALAANAAANASTADPGFSFHFVYQLVPAASFALLGMALFGLAWFIVVKVSPFSIRKEIEEDQNTALGIILGALLIGIAIIIAAAVSG